MSRPCPVVNNNLYEEYGERWYTADDDPVALLRAEAKLKNPWVIKKIREHGGRKILDIGCGAGFLSNALAMEKFQVTGGDLSQKSLTVAIDHDHTQSVRYVLADAYFLPFPDESFDVVTSMDFLEHVEDPQKVIQEVSRVLKKEGIFIYHTFNRNWLSWLVIIKFVEWLVRNTPVNMHVLRLFIKPKELLEYCRRSKMKVLEEVGIKPVFSSIPIMNYFSGIVPKKMRFEFTPFLFLSYMGLAKKNNSEY